MYKKTMLLIEDHPIIGRTVIFILFITTLIGYMYNAFKINSFVFENVNTEFIISTNIFSINIILSLLLFSIKKIDSLLILACGIIANWIIGAIWTQIHQNQSLWFIHFICVLFYCNIISLSVFYFINNWDKLPKENRNKSWYNIIWLIFLVISVITVIIGLLILDLITMLQQSISPFIFYKNDEGGYLIKLYAAAFLAVAFMVQLYVAYVRGMALKQANQTFEFTQEQFNYTQIQKTNEEIEKRFQEGIKLLGNENESVRLGGIYILWEIVKEAVKVLPYITKKHKDKEFKDDMTINNNTPEISAYEKSYSLHTQILNILCAHIRTQTNSEKYLKQYYPSIYRVRYTKQFKEAFGENGENNHLSPEDEKPSSEIQTLLDLLTKSNDNNKNNTPNYILRFRLNFENAILGGASCYKAYFEGANCRGAHFEHAHLRGTHFERAVCEDAHFEGADCWGAHFERAYCIEAHFEGADCEDAHFVRANCRHANFEGAVCEYAHFARANCRHANFKDAKCQHAHFERAYCEEAYFKGANCYKAHFNGAKIWKTTFSAADKIINCNFDGINCDFGECEVLDDNNASIILCDIKQENMPPKEIITNKNKDRLAEYCECPSLKMDTPWRISITEVKRYVDINLFQDNEIIRNHLIAFQAAYEAHNNDKDLFFASLSLEDQKWARYYLNDFGDQDPENTDNQPPPAIEESQQ